ncbi:MAG: PIG-L family deacetylase [Candidatus Paceibacterota bacterium]
MKNNILVITAHPDDEVLGVGGTILKHISSGDNVSILILSDGETSRDSGADINKRERQAKEVSRLLGVSNLIMEKLPDNQFDSIPLLKIIKIIENTVNKLNPSIIYTHHAHDLNIDHRLTFQAVLTVCRPQPKFSVKKILTFETPSSTEWQMKTYAFCPTEYNDIAKFLPKKIDILKIYEDELREYPHPRSLESIKILAQYRGLEVGYHFAEAFQIIRTLND